MDKKFIESFDVNDWEVQTENGFVPIRATHKTIKYQIYEVLTESYFLRAADTHIVFDKDHSEVFISNLKVGDTIKTIKGLETVKDVKVTDEFEHMFDLEVSEQHQSYFTNGILSHNTTTAALYLLWYAMFIPDSSILVAAHKATGADEIMSRIRYAYEICPDHIRAGTTTYASSKIEFDNKSTIVAQTTTENTGRGLSISLLYCLDADTKVTVKDKVTGEIKDVTLQGLYTDLENNYLESIEKVGNYYVQLENGLLIKVPEHSSIYVEDEKTLVGDIVNTKKGLRMNYGNGYSKIVDISYEK